MIYSKLSITQSDIAQLAQNIVEKAQQNNIVIALAESCTGGMIAAALTDVSGSSRVLDRGFVTYSNNAKMDILGVSQAGLRAHGAVSEFTACAMTHGTLIAAPEANLALSVTGIAGPGGGSAEKPVGLVHFSCQRRDAPLRHAAHIFPGNRGQIRQQAVKTALMMIGERAGLRGCFIERVGAGFKRPHHAFHRFGKQRFNDRLQ